MCKYEIINLSAPPPNGPCFVSLWSGSNACAAFTHASGFRKKAAQWLRAWANKIEGVRGFTLIPYGPSVITLNDSIAAMTHGRAAAEQYLNDLWRD